MSDRARDGDDQKTSTNLPATSDCGNDEMMKMILQRLDKQEKDLVEQKKKNDDMEKRSKKIQEELNRVKTELAAYKNFENMYRQLGGETLFYLDLDSLRDIMLEQIGDDEAAKKTLEEWYKKKKSQKLKRIGVGFLTGSVVGAGIGGFACAVHAPILIAAVGGAILSSGGIVLVAMAGGLVAFGLGLGAYKLYRMWKCKQIKKAHEATKLPVEGSLENNDAQSRESQNTENEETCPESDDVQIWEMSANKALLS
ncbi:uncharacterized protein LOC144420960 isoform X2 [Styela clava]